MLSELGFRGNMVREAREIAKALGIEIAVSNIYDSGFNHGKPYKFIVFISTRGVGWWYGPDLAIGKMRFKRTRPDLR